MTIDVAREIIATMSSAAGLIYIIFQLTRNIRRAYWRGFVSGAILTAIAFTSLWIMLMT